MLEHRVFHGLKRADPRCARDDRTLALFCANCRTSAGESDRAGGRGGCRRNRPGADAENFALVSFEHLEAQAVGVNEFRVSSEENAYRP